MIIHFLFTVRFVFLLFAFNECVEHDINGNDVIVFLNMQANSAYHNTRVSLFRRHLVSQLPTNQPPKLIISENDTTSVLFHLILPAIRFYHKEVIKYKWIIFAQEETRLELKQLYHLLSENDHEMPNLLGYGLRDTERSIIHHFAKPHQIIYPHREVGFILSIKLCRMILDEMQRQSLVPEKYDTHIDPQYEMVKFIKDKLISDFQMSNNSEFCLTSEPDEFCALWISPFSFLPNCLSMIEQSEYLVVVKTCKKFFRSRISILKSTWAPEVKNILYFAEVADKKIPTVSVGVPNTETGHCAKLQSILKIVSEDPKWNEIKFVVIADDDTLISIPRLRQLLYCYRQDNKLVLGEKYAYMSWYGSGYDYLTGGSGIVLSMAVVREVAKISFCNSIDWPDDMTLGMWLDDTNQSILHSHLFHQARPEDYSPQRIMTEKAISFHKFWETKPLEIYHNYLNHSNNKPKYHNHGDTYYIDDEELFEHHLREEL